VGLTARAREVRGFILVDIPQWWPVGLPVGKWHAVTKSGSRYYVESPLEVEPHRGPAISTLPSTNINPFENHDCDSYSAGEEVIVLGINFEPNRDLPLAIYHMTGERDGQDRRSASLVRGEMVTTDRQGDFSTSVRVEPSDPTGLYRVIAVTDLDVDQYPPMVFGNVACYEVEAPVTQWGLAGDLPLSGDFDRDGRIDDVAVYRPSTRTWYYDYDHDGDTDDKVEPWGVAGDLPLGGDFDRDGTIDDVAVYRPSAGAWYYDHDHSGATDEKIGP